MHELLVTGLASSGEGVARLLDGRVVFIRGALPGDTVTLKVTQDKARVVFADIAKLVTASSKRTLPYDPRIALSSVPWLGLDYQTQLDAKADNVLQALTRIAKLAPSFRGIKAAPNELHYRHRARLHARKGKLGYFARGTHDLIDRSSAPVCWPELDAALTNLEAWIAGRGVRQVEVVYSRRDGKSAARIEAESG
ncbi:MAG: TRAM domain-containing protein, partial [Clostridia bacterium]|nr:TRAM domain-containing protein [Deltaproteobacteria bacterium]